MRLKNLLLTILGIILLIVGAIGAFLPIWPTTPFVLAAIGCLSANPRLQSKILKISFFKEYMDSYKNKSGLSNKTVIRSLLFLWIMMIASSIIINNFWMSVILILIGVAVTTHILWVAQDRSQLVEN